MHAVIISVGDELVSGAVLDTNSSWLSLHLADHGLEVIRHVTVADQIEPTRRAIVEAAADAQLVLVTGGLGPTKDDLTRQALAAAMGVELVEDRHSLERIAAFFAARDRPMTPSNRMQALVPRGAAAIDNACGTAPGLAGQVGRAMVCVMPGVPHEMADMFGRSIVPRLPASGFIVRRTIHTLGAGESHVGEVLGELMERSRNPCVGTTACAGVISVRILAHGRTEQEARLLADQAAQDVLLRLGDLAFGQDEQTLPQVVGELLRASGATLAVAESCTGGMLGEMLTAAPGASDYFLGGMIAYDNQVKIKQLGVPAGMIGAHGAVSEPVAAAMAERAAAVLGATWGVGITGIAGPTGGSSDKPVGLVYIGLYGPGWRGVHRYVWPGGRDQVRTRATMAALNHLRLALKT